MTTFNPKLVLAVTAACLVSCACGGAAEHKLEVVAPDGTVIELEVTATEQPAVGQTNTVLLSVAENNTTDNTLSYRLGAAIDGCSVTGYPAWADIESMIESGRWPTDGPELPSGSAAGTRYSGYLPADCQSFDMTLVARSEDGTLSKVVVPIVTTATS